MRIVTYNVHDCIGLDRRYDPERIARVLCDIDADLFALQEVTLDHAGELTQMFEAATGMRAIDGSLFERSVGRYGNLILTRAAVVDTLLHDLSRAECEPRGCIEITLDVAGQPLGVFATHLGLRRSEHRTQIASLATLLAERQSAAVLLGDLNVWSRHRGLRPLATLGFVNIPINSFPTRPRALIALDRILARPPAIITRCRRYDTPLARLASDHFPILAEVEFLA